MDTFTNIVKILLFTLALCYATAALFTRDKHDGRYLIVMAHLTLILGWVFN